MPISNKTEWYGVNAAVVRKTDNITVYSIACDTPNGKMKVFHLFPGIDYAETSFKTALCDYRKQTAAEVVEIAYCKAGRFECEIPKRLFYLYRRRRLRSRHFGSTNRNSVFPAGLLYRLCCHYRFEYNGNIFPHGRRRHID